MTQCASDKGQVLLNVIVERRWQWHAPNLVVARRRRSLCTCVCDTGEHCIVCTANTNDTTPVRFSGPRSPANTTPMQLQCIYDAATTQITRSVLVEQSLIC